MAELGASAPHGGGAGDFTQFKLGHQFGAWLGIVPRQNSSGSQIRLGRITKRGDDYLGNPLIAELGSEHSIDAITFDIA